ncbi:FtsH protease activity modulator HflK [Thiohalorhabdus denitrificans]|uniref:Protein HflK n=1 Tax=Thiohalorhabdus denitrificans TaxID=381306 RepID=A0A1G5B3M9_9GAMM|nr:FtsH protease activity modulator HflK [Thiohalorhabdus denitrificans]SCX84701.1 protease FtsH subunit HflK [Thiohalorhabdus denitrificans]
MAWNEPGGPNKGNDKNPWGQWGGGGSGGGGQQPPDLDEIIRKLKAKFGGSSGGGGGGILGGGGPGFSGRGIAIVVGIALLLWLASGIYVVNPAEQGVVKRFGKHTITTEPGLHYHLPWPIESVHTPKVTQVRRIEVGFRDRPGRQDSMHVPKEALMLTGDEAIVDLQFAVQYHISDAAKYLFEVSDPDGTVRSAAETAIREVVGQRPIDDVLTQARAEVAQQTQELMQSILNHYNTGLQVDDLALQSAQAPDPVRPAFRDVISAREDRTRAVNEAQAYANDILPRARGQAERILQEAEGYRARIVNAAQGSASRFRDVFEEYQNAPEVTSQRLYLETMERVLERNEKVMVDIPESGNLLYLPIQEVLKQRQGDSGKAQNGQDQQASGQDEGQAGRTERVRQQFERRLERIQEGESR